MQPVLRPARMCDAKKIHGLLMECSAEGLLLPRSLSNLYGQIRDFRILETSGGEFIGCAALGGGLGNPGGSRPGLEKGVFGERGEHGGSRLH